MKPYILGSGWGLNKNANRVWLGFAYSGQIRARGMHIPNAVDLMINP
jgi:hypothetical protein